MTRQDRALARWCEAKGLYVEEVRFLGSTVAIARAQGVKNVSATVARGINDGYLARVNFEAGSGHKVGGSGPWRGIAARCLGSRAEAWQVAGQLASLLEEISLTGEMCRHRAHWEKVQKTLTVSETVLGSV